MKKNKFYKSEASEPASDFFGMDKAQGISVSACAIMKNEISHVEAWLNNVRVFAQEIIVVDTGSTDGTNEFLAKQFDVKLISYEWQHDFAQAKNVALQEATGDWLVFTDADECFYHPENITEYLGKLDRQSADMDVIFCPIDNIDADNNNEIINSDVVPRIIRNHVGIKYIGAVHEQLTKGGEPWQDIKYVVADRNLAIRHTGYSTKVIPFKHQRNYEILCQVMGKSNKPEMYYGFLSESLLGLEKYQEALEYAVLAMESPYQPTIQKERFAQVAIEYMDKLGLAISDIFSLQQAEAICQTILKRNKWHVGTLCQWLDMKLTVYENDHQEKITDIIQDLHHLYGENSQDIQQLMALLEQNGYIYLAKEFSAHMNIEKENHLEEVYQLLQEKNFSQLEKKILPLMAENIQLLFVALLGCNYSSGNWYQEKLKLLPKAQQILVQLYHGQVQNVALEPDEYITMLDGIILYGSQEMLLKYLQLAQGMPGNKLKKIGHQLAAREYYGEALEIFAQIQAEDEAVTEEFWLDCGICLYYLQDYSNAMAALEKAAEMGNSSNDLKSYIAWCKEAVRE
ncbi:MAG: glycosyltransferase [Veillonellaceae bacterium]|nr:glycosyltransferase [Veillonellaceae bacterium]